jgi:hypothetical protein
MVPVPAWLTLVFPDVYFVVEYVGGRDLMLYITLKQFSLRQAKISASVVLLAFEYFHANG